MWRLEHDRETGAHVHQLPSGFGHALVVPMAIEAFRRLGIAAYIHDQADHWFRLNSEPSVARHEIEHSRLERFSYNRRFLAAARRERKLIRAELGGQTDFFVPIVARGECVAILISGPVELHAPSGEEIEERWRALTGRKAHPADGAFASYLSIVLGTAVLDGDRLALFERLLQQVAALLAGEGDADARINAIERVRAKLDSLRAVERSFKAVASMVDERQERLWSAHPLAYTLGELGLSRVPNHVLVALTAEGSGTNPVAEAVQHHAFQRHSAELAQSMRDVIAGQVGDHGAVFLMVTPRSAAEQRRLTSGLIDRVSAEARRRFGYSLRFGSSPVMPSLPLSRSYFSALAAAERALGQGTRLVEAEANAPAHTLSVRAMRFELGRTAEQSVESLGARFDHYVEVAKAESGYRLDVVRTHLQAGFEVTALRLADQGLLDPKSWSSLSQNLERATSEARTINDLTAFYRGAVSDLTVAVQRPEPARRARSMRRALDYIHRHHAEEMSFAKVAREAGFAPNYFSTLFKRQQGVTFERYLRELRIGHARHLLANSKLEVARIAELSGFHSAQYFSGVFKKTVGTTPLDYRKRSDYTSALRRRRRAPKRRR
jgi:AraC-like DNA-binding protein